MWWTWWLVVASAVLAAEALVRGLEALWRAACAHLDRRQAEAEQEAHEALRAVGRSMQFAAPARPTPEANVVKVEQQRPQWPYGDEPLSAEETHALPIVEPNPRFRP